METEIALRIINVTRQAPQSTLAETRPQQRADGSQQQSGNHQKFAQFIHVPTTARQDTKGNEGFSDTDFTDEHELHAKHFGVRRHVAV